MEPPVESTETHGIGTMGEWEFTGRGGYDAQYRNFRGQPPLLAESETRIGVSDVIGAGPLFAHSFSSASGAGVYL